METARLPGGMLVEYSRAVAANKVTTRFRGQARQQLQTNALEQRAKAGLGILGRSLRGVDRLQATTFTVCLAGSAVRLLSLEKTAKRDRKQPSARSASVPNFTAFKSPCEKDVLQSDPDRGKADTGGGGRYG